MNRGGPRVVFYILCSLVSQLVSGSRWYFFNYFESERWFVLRVSVTLFALRSVVCSISVLLTSV